MAENQTKCTGNCMACTIFQRQYCASQLAYSNMRMLEKLQQVVVSMKENITALGEKVEAMQNNEAMLIDPTGKPAEETAQTERPAADATGTTAVPTAPPPAMPPTRIAR